MTKTSHGDYTIAEIDVALRAILGAEKVRVGETSWTRPHAMYDAASKAFITRRSEDRDTATLRTGLLDLEKFGVLLPRDGVFPDA